MAERRERGGLPGEPLDVRPLGEGPSGPRLRLGEWLRATRMRRGFSLAEIERDTRINRLYLEALEEEHYEVLPAPVYTRGFLRSYARALGLDPDEAISLLPTDLPLPPGLEPPASLRQRGGDAPAISMPSLPQFGLPALNLASRPGMLRWVAAAVGAAILVTVYWFGGALLGGDDATPQTSGTASQAPSAVPTGAAPSAAGTPGVVAPADQAPNFVGMQQDVAQKTLQERGVTWVTVGIASNEKPAGEIVGQTPSAGAPLKRGDNITLVVSRGPSRN